jgi:hypothetical protein
MRRSPAVGEAPTVIGTDVVLFPTAAAAFSSVIGTGHLLAVGVVTYRK